MNECITILLNESDCTFIVPVSLYSLYSIVFKIYLGSLHPGYLSIFYSINCMECKEKSNKMYLHYHRHNTILYRSIIVPGRKPRKVKVEKKRHENEKAWKLARNICSSLKKKKL